MEIQQAIGFLSLIDPVTLTLLQQEKAGCLKCPKSQVVTTCWPSKLKISAENMGHPWAIVYYLLKQLSVQFSHSVVSDSATPWTIAHQASLSINSRSLPKLMSIELVMPSNYLILFGPLLFLPSIFPSIRAFSSESVLRIRWPKYWDFSFNISPSNEHSGLISFRIDCLDQLYAF